MAATGVVGRGASRVSPLRAQCGQSRCASLSSVGCPGFHDNGLSVLNALLRVRLEALSSSIPLRSGVFLPADHAGSDLLPRSPPEPVQVGRAPCLQGTPSGLRVPPHLTPSLLAVTYASSSPCRGTLSSHHPSYRHTLRLSRSHTVYNMLSHVTHIQPSHTHVHKSLNYRHTF